MVASDTAPVREVISHGQTGLLADFYDVEGLAELALRVLRDPAGHRDLGRAAEALVAEHYALEVTLPKMLDLYRRTLRGTPTPPAVDDAGPTRRRPRPRKLPGPGLPSRKGAR